MQLVGAVQGVQALPCSSQPGLGMQDASARGTWQNSIVFLCPCSEYPNWCYWVHMY